MATKRATTTATKPIVDFAHLKESVNEGYPKPVSVLENDGKVTNEAIFKTYSEDDLVHFMELMLWQRDLHEQSLRDGFGHGVREG